MKAIKVMADYDSWPLWHYKDEVGNIDPASLSLSAKLIADLAAWSANYDTWLTVDEVTDAMINHHEKIGRELYERLRRELKDKYKVVYFSEKTKLIHGDK
jgi:hypothetical protein